jgi:hypothetical protein
MRLIGEGCRESYISGVAADIESKLPTAFDIPRIRRVRLSLSLLLCPDCALHTLLRRR